MSANIARTSRSPSPSRPALPTGLVPNQILHMNLGSQDDIWGLGEYSFTIRAELTTLDLAAGTITVAVKSDRKFRFDARSGFPVQQVTLNCNSLRKFNNVVQALRGLDKQYATAAVRREVDKPRRDNTTPALDKWIAGTIKKHLVLRATFTSLNSSDSSRGAACKEGWMLAMKMGKTPLADNTIHDAVHRALWARTPSTSPVRSSARVASPLRISSAVPAQPPASSTVSQSVQAPASSQGFRRSSRVRAGDKGRREGSTPPDGR